MATLKVAEDFPALTTTDELTEAAVEELLSATVMPPVGAFDVSCTVPIDFAPPTTAVGDTVTL